MASRRMFSPDIVASDAFIEMPSTSQSLYFHLGMRADDDGFVNPQITMRMVGANTDDLKMLLAKRFVLPFENGVVVIKHWRMNNFIRKDRYKPTNYIEEKKLLYVKTNGAYTFDPEQGELLDLVPWKNEESIRSTIGQPNVIPMVNAGKVRLGKVREGKYISEPSSQALSVKKKKEKPVKEEEPFILLREIEKLEENNRRDLNIIALYFRQRKTQLQNRAQLQTAIRRHLRSAKELVPFSDDQLIKACNRAKSEYPEIWTLETVTKLLTK